MGYTSFILRGALGFTLGGLFFTQIRSRHADLPGGIWAALALAGAVLGMVAAFSLEGLSAHRHRVKLGSALGFALGGLAFVLVFRALSGNPAMLRIQLPVSAAFAGLLGGMGFGLGWRGPKQAVLLGCVSAIFLPVSMWLNVEIARRAMEWLVSYAQPDSLWIRLVAYGYALVGFTVYGSLFGLALGYTEQAESDEAMAHVAAAAPARPAADPTPTRAAAKAAAVGPAVPPAMAAAATTKPKLASTPASTPAAAKTAAPAAKPVAKPAATTPAAAPAPAPAAAPAKRAKNTPSNTMALVEEARRRAAEPPPQDELERMFAGAKPAKPAAAGTPAKPAGAKTPSAPAPSKATTEPKQDATKRADKSPVKPPSSGPRRMLHPDFAPTTPPPEATPAAAAPAPSAAAPAAAGGFQILRNYHPDFAAGKAPAPVEKTADTGQVVDVEHDEELTFIPDEDDNELGLDVSVRSSKGAPGGAQPKEVDLRESEEEDDYDFLRGED